MDIQNLKEIVDQWWSDSEKPSENVEVTLKITLRGISIDVVQENKQDMLLSDLLTAKRFNEAGFTNLEDLRYVRKTIGLMFDEDQSTNTSIEWCKSIKGDFHLEFETCTVDEFFAHVRKCGPSTMSRMRCFGDKNIIWFNQMLTYFGYKEIG